MTRYAKLAAAALAGLLLAGCAAFPTAPEERDRRDMERDPDAFLEDVYDPEVAGTADERLQRAIGYIRNQQNDAAERELRALAAAYPDYSGALTNLGILQAKNGRTRDAIASLEEAVKRNPQNVVALNWLGHSHRENRQSQRAERAWKDALRVDPDYVAAHVNLGLLYEDVLADARAAVRHYRAAYEASDGKELRVLPWMARLEAQLDGRTAERAAADIRTEATQ